MSPSPIASPLHPLLFYIVIILYYEAMLFYVSVHFYKYDGVLSEMKT